MKVKELDKTKVYYLACPYTAIGEVGEKRLEIQQQRYEEITRIGAKLTRDHGLVVLGPITTSHNFKIHEPTLGTEWAFWKEIDELLIERCSDAVLVAMMDGWADSVGVRAEIDKAKLEQIPIYFLDPETMDIACVVHESDGVSLTNHFPRST